MIINKMGSYHSAYGINNQDAGFESEDILCVCDGCSGGKHSEVGAKLFIKQLKKNLDCYKKDDLNAVDIFEEVFERIADDTDVTLHQIQEIEDYLLFTIMICESFTSLWFVQVFGDGVIITQDHDDNIEFIDVNHSNEPIYLAYDYIPNFKHKEGHLCRSDFIFQKKDYKSIGIASDGLSCIIGSDYEEDFKDLIREKKDFKIKRFINKLNLQYKEGYGFFKDDITIVMK